MTFGIDDAIAAGLRIIDKIVPDPAARAAATLEAVKLKQAGDFKDIDADLQAMQMQIEVNKIEAASPDLFKSGWRPFVGWICGAGLGYQFLLQPFLAWASVNLKWLPPPALDLNTLLPLLLGMLGIGGMRSFEKLKGVTK